MKAFFLCLTILFAGLILSAAEHGPWEDFRKDPINPTKVIIYPAMSAADRKRVYNSFSGDPLAFVADDNERLYLRDITEKLPDRDDYRKRMALAAYFTHENKESDFSFNINNLDSILDSYYKKKTSVDEAFGDFQRMYGVEKSSTVKELPGVFKEDLAAAGAAIVLCLLVLFLFYKFVKVSFMKMFVFFRSFAQKYKSLREHEKIFFFFSIAAIGLMVSAMLTRCSSGFYTLLRCSVCVAFIGKYFGVRSAFLKFMLLAGAIIYNPVIPVRFDDRDIWSWCNFFSILFLIFLENLSFRRKSNGSA